MGEVVHVEVVFIVAKGVWGEESKCGVKGKEMTEFTFDFFTGNQKTKEDERLKSNCRWSGV